MDVAMVAAGTLPHPHDAIGHDKLLSETAKSVEKLRATIELDRFERVFSGKSVAAVLTAYERGERDATLCWFVESQDDAGWTDVTLANGPDDAAALLKLRKVIAARRVARADAVAPDLAVARERLKKIRTATLDSQIRHLVNDRRGLAAV